MKELMNVILSKPENNTARVVRDCLKQFAGNLSRYDGKAVQSNFWVNTGCANHEEVACTIIAVGDILYRLHGLKTKITLESSPDFVLNVEVAH